MPTLSANIKWTTNLDELRKELKSGSDQLVVLQSSAEKTIRSLGGEGIMRAAHNAAAAIQELGGANKLTGAEQDKVNSLMDRAIAKYAALGQTAPTALKDLAAATERVEAPTSRLTGLLSDISGEITGTAAGFISATAIIGAVEKTWDGLTEFVKGSVEAYAEAEAASRRLTVAVQTQGLGIPGLVQQYHDLSDAYQRNTTFSHDAITAAEALFVQLGNVGPEQMDKALRAATDLASGLGIQLEDAVKLVAKAFEGHTSSLQRYGIVIDEAKAKSQGIEYVLDAIEQKVGGQAQAELDTYAGKIKQLGNAWEDFKQAVGESIVQDPLLQRALSDLQQGIMGSGEQAQTAKTYITDWIASLAGVDPLTQGLLRNLRDWVTFDNQVEDALRGVKLQTDALAAQLPTPAQFDVFRNLKKDITDFQASTKDFAADQQEQWKKQQEAADRAAKSFADAVKSIRDSLTHADLTEKAKELAAAFEGIAPSEKTLDLVKRVGEEAADIIVKGGHVPKLLQDIAFATGAIHDPALRFETDWKNIGHVLTDEVTPAFQKTLQRLNEIFNVNRTGLGADLFKNIGTQLEKEAPPAVNALGKVIGDELPKFISDAFSEGWSKGVSRAMDELGAQLGGHLFGNLQQPITNGLSQVLGDSMGAAIGIALPVIGSALFSGLSQLLTDPKTGHGWLHEILWGREGRNEVEDFVSQVYGSFDALHQQLAALGAEGEQLWKQLTQGVGRRDTAAADAAIQAIQNALPSQLTQAAGYQTVAQLQDAAQKAVKIWQYMKDSGQYTSDEIAQAFQKAQDAIAKTGNTTIQTMQASQTAAQQQIAALDSQIQSLQQSIAQEAPEEEMGVIEKQQRQQTGGAPEAARGRTEAVRRTRGAHLRRHRGRDQRRTERAVGSAGQWARQPRRCPTAIRDARTAGLRLDGRPDRPGRVAAVRGGGYTDDAGAAFCRRRHRAQHADHERLDAARYRHATRHACGRRSGLHAAAERRDHQWADRRDERDRSVGCAVGRCR